MKNLIKQFLFLLLATPAFLTACSDADADRFDNINKVAVRISLHNWSPTTTRAAGEMIYPINVLVFPEGKTNASKKITITNGTEFDVKLTSGTYSLYAVCGLDADMVSDQLTTPFPIPTPTDFAVGQTSITVKNNTSTPAELHINAARQMAWLDLQITDVPENIRHLNLHVKNLYKSYTLHDGWLTSPGSIRAFTRLPLTKNETEAGLYEGGGIIEPCADASGVTYIVEAVTNEGVTTMLTYTSAQALTAGTHHTQILEYKDFVAAEGNVALDNWNATNDKGAISSLHVFGKGDQYFSYPATIINVVNNTTTNALYIVAHKPIIATLAEIRNWDRKNIPYTLLPELDVERWAIPSSGGTPAALLNTIKALTWDRFCDQFVASGGTPMDWQAKNIIAYCTSDKTFHRYDFNTGKTVEAKDESIEYLVYPIGVIPLSNNYEIAVGKPYLSHPVTVFSYNENIVNVLSHKPMTVTLDEVRAMADLNNIEYTLVPEMHSARWAITTESTTAGQIINMLNSVGLDELNMQISNSGGTPIPPTATNILAFYDKTNDRFYRYDFAGKCFAEVEGNTSTEFLIYPNGIITRSPNYQ